MNRVRVGVRVRISLYVTIFHKTMNLPCPCRTSCYEKRFCVPAKWSPGLLKGALHLHLALKLTKL